MSAEESTGKRFLTCLDLARGTRFWQVPIPYSIHHHHDFNAAASSTPVVHEGPFSSDRARQDPDCCRCATLRLPRSAE